MSHRLLNVPLELRDFFEAPGDELPVDELREDWLNKFQADAGINTVFGDGRDHSAQLATELAPLNARVIATYQKIAERAQRPNDLEVAAQKQSLRKNAPVRSSSAALAKADSTPAGLRREALRQFIVKSLGNGETVEDLCSFAAVNDPATAAEMRSIAAEMML